MAIAKGMEGARACLSRRWRSAFDGSGGGDAGADERILPALAVIITFPAPPPSPPLAPPFSPPPSSSLGAEYLLAALGFMMLRCRGGGRGVAPSPSLPSPPNRMVPPPSLPHHHRPRHRLASISMLPRLGCALADVRDVEAGAYGCQCASHTFVPAHAPAFSLAVLVLVLVPVPVIGFKTPRQGCGCRRVGRRGEGVWRARGAPAHCTRRHLLPRAFTRAVPVVGRGVWLGHAWLQDTALPRMHVRVCRRGTSRRGCTMGRTM
ncbi:hypothetical protein B0H13DRAFT_2150909 [Mycena leptocephala]|nr:hypothetical protein B0H13DRAFT_2150909 [Mycena leptocephala]